MASMLPRTAERLGFPHRRQAQRWHGWKPDKPDHRDLKYQAGSAPSQQLPPAATLEGAEIFLPAIRDQGDTGCCTGFSMAGALEYKCAQLGVGVDVLSPLFAYYNGRVIEGEESTDAGSEVRDVIKGVHHLGIALEQLWPFSPDRITQRPSYAAYREAKQNLVKSYSRIDGTNLNDIKSSIVNGDPVVFGFSWFTNFDDGYLEKTGLMPMPHGKLDGGHAVWCCGYDDSMVTPDAMGALLIANSWGTDWGCIGPNGQRGYFWMPYAFACNNDLATDYWSIQVVL